MVPSLPWGDDRGDLDLANVVVGPLGAEEPGGVEAVGGEGGGDGLDGLLGDGARRGLGEPLLELLRRGDNEVGKGSRDDDVCVCVKGRSS